MTARDDFTERTKAQIARQVGYFCSFPNCRVATVGSTQDGQGIINIGTLAIKLAAQALRLPHGERAGTVSRLLAEGDYRTRLGLLQSLVVSGEAIDIDRVVEGIAATLEAAKIHTWILTDGNAYLVREWIQLLAFTEPLDRVRSIIVDLPARQRDPGFLEDMVGALADVPTPETEDVLFGLADDNNDFYDNRIWHETVFRLGRPSAVRRYFDVVVEHGPKGRALDDRLIVRRLASALDDQPALRAHAYAWLTTTPDKPGMDSRRREVRAAHIAAATALQESLGCAVVAALRFPFDPLAEVGAGPSRGDGSFVRPFSPVRPAPSVEDWHGPTG